MGMVNIEDGEARGWWGDDGTVEDGVARRVKNSCITLLNGVKEDGVLEPCTKQLQMVLKLYPFDSQYFQPNKN